MFQWNYRTQTTKCRVGEFEAQAGVARRTMSLKPPQGANHALRQARTTKQCTLIKVSHFITGHNALHKVLPSV
jgi:hypothetical protein